MTKLFFILLTTFIVLLVSFKLVSILLNDPDEALLYELEEHLTPFHDLLVTAENNAMDRIEKEVGVHACGTGGGGAHCINSITFTFECGPIPSVEKAREMLAKIITIIMEEINQLKALRPFLIEYPYPKQHLRVFILNDFYPNSTEKLSVDFYKGRLYYSYIDKKYNRESEISETYEEAIQILKQKE